MKVEYLPTKMMIAAFFTKQIQGKVFMLFKNLINITNSEKLAKMEARTENSDPEKGSKSAQECVVKTNKSGGLNMINRDIGSDDINNTVDTRDIILRVKPDLLSRLNSVAARLA